MKGNAKTAPMQTMVVEYRDGDYPARAVFESIQIVERDSIDSKTGEAMSWGITATAYPNANGDAYEILFTDTEAD